MKILQSPLTAVIVLVALLIAIMNIGKSETITGIDDCDKIACFQSSTYGLSCIITKRQIEEKGMEDYKFVGFSGKFKDDIPSEEFLNNKCN